MSEALIHIGDAKTNTWRDGDVMEVRVQDGTFSRAERVRPFMVIPLGAISRSTALELTTTGVVYDVFGVPLPATRGYKRKYVIDWKALLAKGDGTVDGRTAVEADVLAGKTVTLAPQSYTVAKVR